MAKGSPSKGQKSAPSEIKAQEIDRISNLPYEVNLEHLANWEEKQMFKDSGDFQSHLVAGCWGKCNRCDHNFTSQLFMEDHNTTTFPSKKYQMEKEMRKGIKKVQAKERTVFNDEEQRRLELFQAGEKHKEEQVIALKCSMESGMAQAMKEQAQLREEMAYQYKLGNFEASAAIQRRLDPDAAI